MPKQKKVSSEECLSSCRFPALYCYSRYVKRRSHISYNSIQQRCTLYFYMKCRTTGTICSEIVEALIPDVFLPGSVLLHQNISSLILHHFPQCSQSASYGISAASSMFPEFPFLRCGSPTGINNCLHGYQVDYSFEGVSLPIEAESEPVGRQPFLHHLYNPEEIGNTISILFIYAILGHDTCLPVSKQFD